MPASTLNAPTPRAIFNNYVCHGEKGLSREQRNALSSTDDQSGGYLAILEEIAVDILRDLNDNVLVRRHARIRPASKSKALGIRKRTARASTFTWNHENDAVTFDESLRFGKRVLHPYHLHGGFKVSCDLLLSNPQYAGEVVSEEFAEDAGSVMEDAYFTGDGHNKPLGVYTASDQGISTARDVSTGNTTTAVTYAGLVNALFALPARFAEGARWTFHDDILRTVVDIVDGSGNRVFQWGAGPKGENLLLGLPVDRSDRSPNTATTGQYVGLLANWWYYNIADSLDMELQQLNELFYRENQVGFISRSKTDGQPVDETAFVRVQLG